MKKFRLALAASMILMLGCIQPVYADESPVISNVTEATPEEKAAAFIEKYSAKLDELIELTKSDDYSVVTDKMREFAYTDMVVNLPYSGFCYPTANGNGLKVFNDYLYCGNLVNGVADGNGKMYRVFVNQKTSRPRFGVYIGAWSNDAPNGSGEEWQSQTWLDGSKKVIKVHYMGNFVNWYQDGDMVSEYYQNDGRRVYRYHVTDKIPDVIDTKVTRSDPHTPVSAYAEDYPSSFLTFYNTAQTVLGHPLDDGIKKNSHGYWNVGL